MTSVLRPTPPAHGQYCRVAEVGTVLLVETDRDRHAVALRQGRSDPCLGRDRGREPVRVGVLPAEHDRLREGGHRRAARAPGFERVLDAPEVPVPVAVDAEQLAHGDTQRAQECPAASLTGC
jgi:hypothetical protein